MCQYLTVACKSSPCACHLHTCLTPCLSIISWKISPPFLPTKLWSSSGWRYGCRGCASRSFESSRLNAGLGTVRVAVADEAVAASDCRAALAETLRFVVVWAWVAVVPLLYGDNAATREVDERFRRARGRHWSAWRAECDCSMAVYGVCVYVAVDGRLGEESGDSFCGD
jgi:hypothetical protein